MLHGIYPRYIHINIPWRYPVDDISISRGEHKFLYPVGAIEFYRWLFDMLSTLSLLHFTSILCSLRHCTLRCCTLRCCTLRCCDLRWNFVCIRCFTFWLYTLKFSHVIYVENVVVYVVFDNNVYNMLSTSFLCYLRCCTLRHCTLR